MATKEKNEDKYMQISHKMNQKVRKVCSNVTTHKTYGEEEMWKNPLRSIVHLVKNCRESETPGIFIVNQALSCST